VRRPGVTKAASVLAAPVRIDRPFERHGRRLDGVQRRRAADRFVSDRSFHGKSPLSGEDGSPKNEIEHMFVLFIISKQTFRRNRRLVNRNLYGTEQTGENLEKPCYDEIWKRTSLAQVNK
jgi:hypothetical protein